MTQQTDSEKQQSCAPAPTSFILPILRVIQITLTIGIIIALSISWHVRSYGSVFHIDEGGPGGFGNVPGGFDDGFGGGGFGGPGFGGFDYGFEGPFDNGFNGPRGFNNGFFIGPGGQGPNDRHFGVLGSGTGGEDGLGLSDYGDGLPSSEPLSSIAYIFAIVVAAVSFIVSVISFFMGVPLVQVGLDAFIVILWLVCSSLLATTTSICMSHDRDRMFVYYMIQGMGFYLPWNFAEQFEENINLYCGGVFTSIVLGMHF
jgi:hypothetical protein